MDTATPANLARRLRRAATSGVIWSTLAQGAGLCVRFVSSVVLARLLAPEAYGLLGVALAVVTTLDWLSDVGVQPALVRHPRGDEPGWLLTGWWIGLARGSGLAAVGVLLAWPAAAACGLPAAAPLLAALSLRPALLALRSPAFPLLRRQFRFRAMFADEVGQTIAGTAVSLALAWWTGSPWAVVAGTLAGAAASVVLSWALVPLAPAWRWEADAAAELRRFGGGVFLNTLVMAAWLNLDRFAGPRLVSLDVLGVYVVAWNLAATAESLVVRWCDVQFGLLARLEGAARRAWHQAACRQAASLLVPALGVGVLLAPLAVGMLYDARYRAAGPALGVLLARLMLRAFGQVQFQYLLASGRLRATTRAYAAGLVAQAAAVVPLTMAGGAAGLALSALLSTAVVTAVQTAGLAGEDRGEWSRLGGVVVRVAVVLAAFAVLVSTWEG